MFSKPATDAPEPKAPPPAAPREPSGLNRYRLQLKHPEIDGLDVEVMAEDEAGAIEAAAAQIPEGTFCERVVPLEINALEVAPKLAEQLKGSSMAKGHHRDAARDDHLRNEHGNPATANKPAPAPKR